MMMVIVVVVIMMMMKSQGNAEIETHTLNKMRVMVVMIKVQW